MECMYTETETTLKTEVKQRISMLISGLEKRKGEEYNPGTHVDPRKKAKER